MSSEWANQFKHFALAVDYVDESIVDDVKTLLRRYFEETLEICYFRFLTEGPGTETPDGILPTLETVWSSSDEKTGDVALFTRGGAASGHLALCYELRKPLWITAKEGGLLVDAGTDLVDGWSRVKDLPAYQSPGEPSARTSIIVPLRYGDQLYGVMDLELEERISFSPSARDVVKTIADGVGRIIWLNKMTATQIKDTGEAFAELERSYSEGTSPLRRPTVFVASSASADEQVMQTILGVLEEFKGTFDVNYWKAESSSGSIAEQVRLAIADAAFGVCYISEPCAEEGSKYRFLDNPNVLCEAGMLQMLHEVRDDRAELVSRWIPVREGPEVTPPLPFDFAGDRVILVPRPGEAIDADAFAESLRKTVREIVDDLDIG